MKRLKIVLSITLLLCVFISNSNAGSLSNSVTFMGTGSGNPLGVLGETSPGCGQGYKKSGLVQVGIPISLNVTTTVYPFNSYPVQVEAWGSVAQDGQSGIHVENIRAVAGLHQENASSTITSNGNVIYAWVWVWVQTEGYASATASASW
jgi:hypothetical protein